MPIKPEHLDELLAGYEKPGDLLGEGGLFKQRDVGGLVLNDALVANLDPQSSKKITG
jgi:hypothetical protein